MFRSVIPISSNSIAAPSKRETIWSRYSRYLAWSRPSLVPPGKNAPIPRDKPLVSCLMADIRAASPSPPFHRFPSFRHRRLAAGVAQPPARPGGAARRRLVLLAAVAAEWRLTGGRPGPAADLALLARAGAAMGP